MNPQDPPFYRAAPGGDLLLLFAKTLAEKYGDHPLRLGEVHVFVPTQRAKLRLQDAFKRHTNILPKLHAISGFDPSDLLLQDPACYHEWATSPPPLSPLKGMALLKPLLGAYLAHVAADQGGKAASFAWVQALWTLLENVVDEEGNLAALGDDCPEAHTFPLEQAAHYEKAFSFLGILQDAWPALLHEEGHQTPAQARRNLLDLLSQVVTQKGHALPPIWCVGLHGSLPSVARFMGAIAQHNLGGVILPDVKETPALFGTYFKQPLALEDPDTWALSLPIFGESPRVQEKRPHLWVCESPHMEAERIGLYVRDVLARPRETVMIVTPKRALARHIRLFLQRWGIQIDDSAGQPLLETPLGQFMRLSYLVLKRQVRADDMMQLLSHPFVQACPSGGSGAALRRLEKTLRQQERGEYWADVLPGVAEMADDAPAEMQPLLRHILALEEMRKDCGDKMDQGVAAALAAHQAWMLALRGETDNARLFPEGVYTQYNMDFWPRFLVQMEEPLLQDNGFSYGIYLQHLMEKTALPMQRTRTHPRVQLLGVLESRLMQADHVILAGVNEGDWPKNTHDHVWLSPAVRRGLGLPADETLYAQQLNDFSQLWQGGTCIISRAQSDGGDMTVPSRFLSTVYGPGEEMAAAHGQVWHQLHQRYLCTPQGAAPSGSGAPLVPLNIRPRTLSLSDIMTVHAMPYVFYVQRILGLQVLPEFAPRPLSIGFGIAIHGALKTWVPTLLTHKNRTRAAHLAMGRQQLEQMMDQHFPPTPIRRYWMVRGMAILDWVYDQVMQDGGHITAYTEVPARVDVVQETGPITVRGIVDRVDVGAQGDLTILDYKTGQVPLKKHIQEGQAPQLLLAAYMVAKGAFQSLFQQEGNKDTTLAYWQLTGKAPGGSIVSVTKPLGTWEEMGQTFMDHFLAYYLDPAFDFDPQAPLAFPLFQQFARQLEMRDQDEMEKEEA